MNTEKIKTLEQVQDALDIVEKARADSNLTDNERLKLETASVKLRHIERSIIRIKTEELVTTLTNDTVALKNVADEIKKSAEKLASVSKAIEKAANILETFIGIVAKAITAGLI